MASACALAIISGIGFLFGMENSLSQSLTALPALSEREPLAKPETLRLSRKLSHYAKGSPFGRAGALAPERARMPPFCQQNAVPQNRQRLSLAGEPEKPSGFDGAGRSGEVLGGGHLGNLGAVGLEGLLQGGKIQAQRLGGLGVDGDDAVIKGLVGQVCGGLAVA